MKNMQDIKKKKILNLFAGIGGNRTLWGNHHDITAIEHFTIAAYIYYKRFPRDNIIVTDAYTYFEEHFHEFDVIWASPPCATHSRMTNIHVGRRYKGWNMRVQLPDMRLYGLIRFLENHFRGEWIVENVKPYYKPLIPPTATIGRHFIWSSRPIPDRKSTSGAIMYNSSMNYNDYLEKMSDVYNIPGIVKQLNSMAKPWKYNNDMIGNLFRNAVLPDEGKHVLDHLLRGAPVFKQKNLSDFGDL